jgi:hypothetical protein
VSCVASIKKKYPLSQHVPLPFLHVMQRKKPATAKTIKLWQKQKKTAKLCGDSQFPNYRTEKPLGGFLPDLIAGQPHSRIPGLELASSLWSASNSVGSYILTEPLLLESIDERISFSRYI